MSLASYYCSILLVGPEVLETPLSGLKDQHIATLVTDPLRFHLLIESKP